MKDKELYKNLKEEWDDGLFFYTKLPLDDFPQLRCQILFDTNKSYIAYSHVPCVFIWNAYTNKCKDFIAVSISNDPEIIYMPKKLGIYRKDLYDAIEFVKKHYITLLNVASEKIDLYDALKLFRTHINESLSPINEMAILPTYITGLPQKIWIDDGNTWKQSGHGPRIKAQIDSIKSSKQWPSISIPDAIVYNNEKNGKAILSDYYIGLLKKFIQYNNENLNRLINDKNYDIY